MGVDVVQGWIWVFGDTRCSGWTLRSILYI